MSFWKTTALVLGVGVVAAVAAGGIGAGMATALVTQFTDEGPPGPSDVPDRETREITSAVLGETRHVTVFLPDFYARDTETNYPVWVVLDGARRGSESASAARTFQRAGLAPGHLVVSIDNVPRGRTQDFLPPDLPEPVDGTTGGADAFLQFIETELLPEGDSLYRTTDVRLLSGHSCGGVFAAYALTERPDLFDGVFAFSPSLWATRGALVDQLERQLADGPSAVFYANLGDEQGPVRDHVGRLAELTDGTSWQVDLVPGASHGATPRLGTPAALQTFYSR